MKKSASTIVGLLIIAIIIGVGVYNGIQKTRESKVESQTRIEEVLIKKTILQAAVLYEEWYTKNNNTYLGFFENKENAEKMTTLINEIKSKNIDAYYYSHPSLDAYVIKIRPAGSEIFYCFDSGNNNLEVKIISADDKNYKSQTTCSGTKI